MLNDNITCVIFNEIKDKCHYLIWVEGWIEIKINTMKNMYWFNLHVYTALEESCVGYCVAMTEENCLQLCKTIGFVAGSCKKQWPFSRCCCHDQLVLSPSN